MNCKNCGNVINSGDKVCPNCGSSVIDEILNQPVDVPMVQQDISYITQQIETPVVENKTQDVAPKTISEDIPKEERKNPNTVLYIVLAVVFVVAVVCLTLVITQKP